MTYKKISRDEFLKKVMALMWTGSDDEDEDSDKLYPNNLPEIIKNDLSSVSFDWENFTEFSGAEDTNGFAEYPFGYCDLGNDFHIFFGQAGGDSEYPLCFIYFWDGENIRAYIPSNGNVYDKEIKKAFLFPTIDTAEIFDKLISTDKMKEEIKNNIKVSI